MKLSSANLIALGQRELRAKGEKCDPACFVWYGCGNSKPDGLCEGFILLDGETKRHLHKLLSEEDGNYVTNCVRMLQSGSNEEALVQEVLRYLPEAERQPKETGFTAMLTAARSSNPTSQHTEPAEPRSRSGFIRMLEASSKNASSEDAVQRALDEIVADEAKYVTAIERANENIIPRQTGFAAMLEVARPSRAIEKPEPEIHGVYGFRAMVDGASRGNATGEAVGTQDRMEPTPYGFLAMLESMFPTKTRETLDNRSHIRCGIGFKAMLDGASRGTE